MGYELLTSAKSIPVAKIEENFIARLAYFDRAPQVDFTRNAEMIRLRTEIGFPHYLFNVVPKSHFASPESAHSHINSAIDDVKARSGSLFWVVGPSTQPVDLGYYLKAHGFQPAMRCAGMTLDLELLREDVAFPSGLTVERVTNRTSLHQFVDVLAENARMPRWTAQAMYEIEDALGFDTDLPRRRYLGLWYGEPVATVTLFAAAGVVGVYHVATVPRARGYGIASAMSLAALQDTRQLEQRHVTLIATTMGESVYRRLGFSSRAEFDVYLWSTGQEPHG